MTQSRLLWIGLAVAISFGLVIEAMKSTRNSGFGATRSTGIFGFNDDSDSSDNTEAKQTHRQKADRARSRLLRGRIADVTAKSIDASITQKIAAAAPVAGLANLANPTKINLDEAAKKKAAEKKAADAKKKKKKKKKKSSPTTDGTTPVAPTWGDDDDGDDTDSSSGGFGASGTYGGGGSSRTIIGMNAAVNENPETLEEWIAYIMPEPVYERVMKLISQNQVHAMDSDIFHEVIVQMLADSRPKMHEYAVLALGSAPSVKSFLLLEAANLAQADGSSLKVQSRTYLKAYSKIENLRYLANAISSEIEAGTTFEALRLIQIAVQTYKPKTSGSTGGGSSGSGATGTVKPSTLVVRQFSPLVPVLIRVASMTKDATVRQEASLTLEQVQTLVKGSTTTASAY